ncbi:hypothetical protein VA7868_03767 [Vibrio aerogenes CECT 7868]|uniref:Uncharacterized protein n=1 Tax=Vibrio aerogenes CECT 7868 TaxID=1216006 RepID=A0A1M6BDH7_9VIBR|nr:hypothetical protein [Vibrio aerogenes]SHI46791.1 hypothetical protein VA7868_03767 [Vibrio aerogenes CECT 7868]
MKKFFFIACMTGLCGLWTVETQANLVPAIKTAVATQAHGFDHQKLMDEIMANNQTAVREMIKSKDYDPNYLFSDGKSYFDGVMTFDNCEMAAILLASGISTNLKTSGNQTIAEKITRSDSLCLKKLLTKYTGK